MRHGDSATMASHRMGAHCTYLVNVVLAVGDKGSVGYVAKVDCKVPETNVGETNVEIDH